MYRSYTVLLLVFLVSSTSAAGADRRKPSSAIDVDCPHGCRCTLHNLDCRNAHLQISDLNTVRPEVYSMLDTIDFSGAKISDEQNEKQGDISNGLFPDGIIHPLVTSVNLTNCSLTRLSSKTFRSIPKVEFLDISLNSIEYAGRGTFNVLQNLKHLTMKNSLKRRHSAVSQADLLAEMFEIDSSYPVKLKDNLAELATIDLGDNGISVLYPSTFCKVQGLMRLELANNELSAFEVQESCFRSLTSLVLSGNNFTNMSSDLWDHMSKVTALDISSNPLICDCTLQPMIQIAKTEKNDFLNQGKTLCAGPENMKGKEVFELKEDLCKTGGWGFGTFLLLALLASGVLFAYRHYSRRRRIDVPFEFGYHGLECDDEVQPEFV